jgi:hypothetical protein
VTAVPGGQLTPGALSGPIAAAVKETEARHAAVAHLDALARRWGRAFETAGSALRAATPYLRGQELGERSRRLADERSDVTLLLQGLAHELKADSGFVRWLAAPSSANVA